MDKVIVDIHVDEDGDVTLNIPPDAKIAPGDYKTKLPAALFSPEENAPWTPEELRAALTPHPVPANQIKTGGWEDLGIEDSAKWVEDLRRDEEERRQWPPRS